MKMDHKDDRYADAWERFCEEEVDVPLARWQVMEIIELTRAHGTPSAKSLIPDLEEFTEMPDSGTGMDCEPDGDER
jgi:hypothetical protein